MHIKKVISFIARTEAYKYKYTVREGKELLEVDGHGTYSYLHAVKRYDIHYRKNQETPLSHAAQKCSC